MSYGYMKGIIKQGYKLISNIHHANPSMLYQTQFRMAKLCFWMIHFHLTAQNTEAWALSRAHDPCPELKWKTITKESPFTAVKISLFRNIDVLA